MSRVIVLGLDNKSVGEFDAFCMPSWSLGGNPSLSPGGSMTLSIPDTVAAETWLDFGRMVILQPDHLPAYAGIIDTPWNALTPVELTVYDAEYLLSLRIDEAAPVKYTGGIDTIMDAILRTANQHEELFLRMGTVGEIDRTNREETLDGRSLWDQMQALALRSGTEFVFRPVRAADLRWEIHVDLARQMGEDTGFLLSDGENGNMTLNSAMVKGKITNRMVGVNSASTAASRLTTPALLNRESIERWRMRNATVQFRDVTIQSTLEQNTQNALAVESKPYLELNVDVRDVNGAFEYLRMGNRVIVHASQLRLPGGKHGWRGVARIVKMAYREAVGTVGMTLTGAL